MYELIFNLHFQIIHDIASQEEWYKEDLCPLSEILSCIGRLYNNRFSIMDFENNEFAIGMFPIVYLINHRCSPNAVFVFDGVSLILRSITTIHKNEEISVSMNIILQYRFPILIQQSQVMFVISILDN